MEKNGSTMEECPKQNIHVLEKCAPTASIHTNTHYQCDYIATEEDGQLSYELRN